MKLKNKICVIGIVLMICFLIFGWKDSKAGEINPPMYLGLLEYRSNTDPKNMAYGIANPDPNSSMGDISRTATGAKIWDIVKYNSLDDTNYDNSINYYCVKAGVGFRNTAAKDSYNISYDFKTERKNMQNSNNDVLKSIVSDEVYYKLLAMADLMYVPGESTVEERVALKNAALIAANIDIDEFEVDITDTDIEAVQQAALWYFTNHDDELFETVYDQLGLGNQGWFTYKLMEMSEYQSFKDYDLGGDRTGEQRTIQAVALYNYLINTAKQREQSYIDGTAKSNTEVTLYAYSTSSDVQPVITIEKLPPEGSYQIQLEKVDKDNTAKKLSGAEFQVTVPEKQAEIKTTDVNGIIDLGTVNITDITTADTIIVKETQAPTGYNKILDTMTIQVQKQLENGEYKAKTASITTGGVEGTSVSIVDNVVKIVVANELIEGNYQIQLEKVDKDNTTKKLSGAEFQVTAPGKQAEIKRTDVNGVIDLGTVNITDITTADTIIVKETQAPAGYNKILDTMTIQVQKQLENGAYKAKTASITAGGVEGTSVSIVNNVVKIVVANELIEGNYQIQLEKVDKDNTTKKLSGAEFQVTVPGKQAEIKTTDVNGVIDLGTVNITDITTADTIIVKETQAPTGYNKILDTMTIQVQKQLENGAYKAKTASITAGGVEGTSVSIVNNVVKIVVANELIEGNYQIQLEKVDKDNTTKKLSGAEFQVTVPGKQAEIKTTDDSGLIDLGTIKIDNIQTTDNIVVKETQAPEGYNKILDAMTIEVQKQVENGVYKAKTATITTGQVEGTSVSIENNVVKIVVADELIVGNYQVQLEKVGKDSPTKKLKGAKFEVTIPEKEAEIKTTGENGIIDLGTIKIEDIQTTDTITVKEIQAPTGYNKILEEMTIKVQKQVENGVYKAKTATITTGQVEGTSVSIENNVVKIVVADELIEGNYRIQLEKIDKDIPSKKLQGAEFQVTVPGKQPEIKTTNADGLIDLGIIPITDITIADTITVKETQAPTGYNKILDTMTIQVQKQLENGEYKSKTATIIAGGVEGTNVSIVNNVVKISVANKKKVFDLSLRKYITKINEETYNREPNVNITNLVDGSDTTAIYNHPKNAISVRRNDIITYTIRVYNEGELDGYANEITDFLPDNLEFLENDPINQKYEWKYNEAERKVTTDYLAKNKETEQRSNLIQHFDASNANAESALKYKEVQIVCKVNSMAKRNKKLTNIAEITGEVDENGEQVKDIDSNPKNLEKPSQEKLPQYKEDEIEKEYIPGQQDDDDFEKVIVQEFDLSLRKFITKVEDEEVTSRIPQVTYDEQNEEIKYTHPKIPIEVESSDIVTYTIRVYNEGELKGYAKQVADDIPEGLEFLPENETNQEYRWEMYRKLGTGEIANEKTIVQNSIIYVRTTNAKEAEIILTDYLSKEQGEARIPENTLQQSNPNLLNGFNKEEEISGQNPDYRDVKVAFKVIESSTSDKVLINSAHIQEDEDENGDPIDDIDSTPGEWNEGEDDQDKEYIKVKPFDLALRKFITGINNKEVTTRIPEVKYDPENQKIVYEHTKEPMDVVTNDVVTYTIRVYNEGETYGYAKRVADDIPDGLEFLPQNEINQEYRWEMYRKLNEEEELPQESGATIEQDGEIYVRTTNPQEAEVIVTDYLSKAQGEAKKKKEATTSKNGALNKEMETDEEQTVEEQETEMGQVAEDEIVEENPNLLKPFDKTQEISEKNPDYRDIKVAFKVIEPQTSDKIVVNSAQIQEDENKKGELVDDIDSVPGKWNEGEDDQDKEYIKLTYFDLALRKWVTQAIVIEDGKQSVTQTGHTAEMDPEPIVKVDIHKKKLSQVTVKFKYSIRITNEGDIAGYAKEITDYVPQGLKFVAEDNKGWNDEGNNVISTRLLENTLLQPGESAEVEVLLTWVNGQDNLGLKTNTAEISEDYNDKGAPDIDSTPDNKLPKEDDIDDAPVMLSVSTGQARIYYTLGMVILITLGAGILLIKKYVL